MRKNKRNLEGRRSLSLILLCLLLLVLGVGACGKSERSENTKGTYIWCFSGDKNSIEKLDYEISGKTASDQVDQMLEDYKTLPKKEDLNSLFQKGISVVDWKLEDEKLDLNFNSAYRDMKPSEELLFRYFLVRSLCQIDGVDYVSFFVETEALKDAENQNVGYMNQDSFVQNIGMSLHNYQSREFVFYFPDTEGKALVKESRQVRYNSNKSKEKVIVEELLKGAKEGDTQGNVLENVKLLGISVRDHICYVNFDGSFLDAYSGRDPELTIYSIVNSIIENQVADKVQISVNGSTNINYGDVVDLSRPLEFKNSLIKE